MAILVRAATRADSTQWEAMRQMLWPDDEGAHAREIAAFFDGQLHDVAAALLAIDDSGRSVGFEEVDRVVRFRKTL